MEASTYRLPTESRGMSEAALILCFTVDTMWVFFCMSIVDFYLADAHAYFGGDMPLTECRLASLSG